MVERGGLENRYTFTGIEGSNPSLSAIRALLRGEIENVKLKIEKGHVFTCAFVFQFSIFNFQFVTRSQERWPSGLRRTLGKRVYCKRYRGFESHSLRHAPR